MRDGQNIADVIAAGANWIGMIFYPKSPRFVSMIPTSAGIIPDKAAPYTDVKADVKRVGVFVDDMAQNIITRVVNYSLDIVQLHGQESPTLIRNLRATIDLDIHRGIKFIKAISVGSSDDFNVCKQYEGVVDYFLFDTRCDTKGGSGHKFNWSLLDEYKGKTPFLLSGGISLDDVTDIKAIHHPQMIGVDINSRFETEAGVKDADKIRTFINELKQQE